jgi:hypothetical protein
MTRAASSHPWRRGQSPASDAPGHALVAAASRNHNPGGDR